MSEKEEKGEKSDHTEDTTEEEEEDSDDEKEQDWKEKFIQKYLYVLCIFSAVLAVITILAIVSLAVFLITSYEGGSQSLVFSESVKMLDSESIDSVLNEETYGMVMFFAPWCGHCKHAKPEYSKLGDEYEAMELGEGEPKINIAAVDCDSHKDVCSKIGVRGYPTFKMYKKGTWKSYSGGRTVADFKEFIELSLGPTLLPVKNKEDLEKIFKKFETKTIVVGKFHTTEKEDVTEYYDTFHAIAEKNDNMIFAEMFVDDMDSREMAVYPYWDREDIKSGALLKEESLVEEELAFLGNKLVENFSGDTYSRLRKEGKHMLVLFVEDEGLGWMNTMLEELAYQARRKFITAYGNVAPFKMQLDMMFGIGLKYPIFVVFDQEGNNYLFEEDGDISVDSVSLWMNGVMEGKIESYYRSEKIPVTKEESELTKGVKRVVGKSFKEVVFNGEGVPSFVFFGTEEMIEENMWLLERLALEMDDQKLVVAGFDTQPNALPPSVEVKYRPVPKMYYFNGVDEKITYDLGKWFMAAVEEGKEEGAAFDELKSKLVELMGVEKVQEKVQEEDNEL